MPLLDDLENRLHYDSTWKLRNFVIAATFLWLGVGGSFGSSIAAAFKAPAWIVAITAAIPGVVIIVDRTFSFAARGRWHDLLYTNIDALARALKYEDAAEKEISQKFSELLKASQESYPTLSTSGFNLPMGGKMKP
jgi:hypothetical protein